MCQKSPKSMMTACHSLYVLKAKGKWVKKLLLICLLQTHVLACGENQMK